MEHDEVIAGPSPATGIADKAQRAAETLATGEVVERFGSAAAEFIKGYTGVDNETGQVFAKGLKGIAEGRLNPEFLDQNLKQQAGYAAEVAATSRDNARAIIERSPERTVRSDDLAAYGKNHNVVDRVKVLNGELLQGTQAQMKFVGDLDALFSKIAKPDGKFARYRGVKLELPSEQFEGAREACLAKAQAFRDKASHPSMVARPDEAARLNQWADNYAQLADNIKDSGLTTEDALFYRTHPKIATARDIGITSHKAGLDGARAGAAIGASVSLLRNAFAVAQERKTWRDAVCDVTVDTGKAAAFGYASAASGAALKGFMQQSSRSGIRAISKTSAPAMALDACITLGDAIRRYINDEIDGTTLLEEVGEKGATMLSSGMMAALGQAIIPIPVVGAAVGAMIGCALTSMFYQETLKASREARDAKANLARILAIHEAASVELVAERAALAEFIRHEMADITRQTEHLFDALDTVEGGDTDAVARAIDSYAELLGTRLRFGSLDEFDDFMSSDEPLRL